MEKLVWHTEKRKIKDIVPWNKNPRKMNAKQKQDLKDSLEKFNLMSIPVIDSDNTIVSGHQRMKIMVEVGRGDEEIDVRVPNRKLTKEEYEEANIRENKNIAEFDFSLLANFDASMLEMVGFDSDDLDKIFPVTIDEHENGVPQSAPAITHRGDIYQLGNHRLMCGDSTSVDDVDKLMAGKKSQMIHTDPPYNVDYGANKKHPSWKIRAIENDKQSPQEWESFCKALYAIFKIYNEGDIYMWGASGPEGMRMRLWLVELGCHWSATIVWKKQQLVLSPANYQRMYEPCFYGWFDKSSFGEDRTQTEVWEIDRPHDSKLHPTMKPIELCARAIVNSSKRGDIVLDLFLGSGSTMIACEKTERICYGMEISPEYCDVIIKRWEDYTGKKAERLT